MNRKKGIMNLYGRNNMVMMLSDKIYGSLGSRTTYVTHNAKGKPPLVLHNTLQDSVVGIEMQGWTEQVSTTGAQLFDKTGIVLTGTIITYTPVNVGDGEFTLSTDYIANNRSDIFFLSGNVNSGASSANNGVDSENNRTVTSENGYVTVALRLNSDGVTSPLDYQIMLNSGSKAKPYEPYTGGKPSPSPEYPQPITSAGKYNEETQKYEYQVKLTGKNLWNAEEAAETSKWVASTSQNGYYDFAIEVKPGEKVTFSFPEKLPLGKGFYAGIVTSENGSIIKWLYHDLSEYLTVQQATVTAITDKIWIRCNQEGILKFVSGNPYFQVEYGGERTGYQAYKEQTVTLTSDRPLTKWDKLEKRNGQWGWVYKSGRYTVTGEEFFASSAADYHGEQTSDAWLLVDDMLSKVWIPSDGPGGYCEKLSWSQVIWAKDGSVGFTYNVKQIHIRLNNADVGITSEDTLIDIANKIKEYVGQQYQEGNPFVFWYETTEETFVPLSASEQELMNALYTFRPTTVLSNDQDCVMKITYKASE